MGTKGQAGRHTHKDTRLRHCVCSRLLRWVCAVHTHWHHDGTGNTMEGAHVRRSAVHTHWHHVDTGNTIHQARHTPQTNRFSGSRGPSRKLQKPRLTAAHTACRNATSQTGTLRCHSHWQLGVAVCCQQRWWPHLTPRWYEGLAGAQLHRTPRPQPTRGTQHLRWQGTSLQHKAHQPHTGSFVQAHTHTPSQLLVCLRTLLGEHRTTCSSNNSTRHKPLHIESYQGMVGKPWELQPPCATQTAEGYCLARSKYSAAQKSHTHLLIHDKQASKL